MKLAIKVILFLVTVFLSYLTAYYFGFAFEKLFPEVFSGGWIGSYRSLFVIRGFSLTLLLFLSFVLRAFLTESRKKSLYSLLPIFAWEFYLDVDHIYVPIILGAIGWFLGEGIRKLIGKKKTAGSPSPRV